MKTTRYMKTTRSLFKKITNFSSQKIDPKKSTILSTLILTYLHTIYYNFQNSYRCYCKKRKTIKEWIDFPLNDWRLQLIKKIEVPINKALMSEENALIG